ncbi:MAG: penicillin-binding transpeptidase domain-containing protein, partial [Bdellovibrionia bacterium]
FSRGIPTKTWNSLLNNENHPLRDKTIQDHYSPGSVFKIVTAIAALQEGVIDENTKFHCPGVIKIGNRLYHCHSRHGEINVVRAITQSCDVFFYRVAQKLRSVDDIAKWATILGLGKKTGINLAGEVPGLIPTEEWKKRKLNQEWNAGETATVAIGQSFVLTTTLQLSNLYAALANGGTLFRPFIVKKIESSEGEVLKEYHPEILSQVHLNPKTVELVKQGLWGVMNSPIGTGYSQRIPGVDFAGKTGTVQVIRLAADKIYTKCETMKFHDRHNAIFVGFAPIKDPSIAVAIVGEHACHGATGAAPIARAIIKKYLEKYFPDVYGEKAIAARTKGLGKNFIQIPPKAALIEDEGFADGGDENDTLPASGESLPVPLVPPTLPGDTQGDSADDENSSEADRH